MQQYADVYLLQNYSTCFGCLSQNLLLNLVILLGRLNKTTILISSNEMQQYADVYLRQNYSTCFGCLSHPSSGVHKILTAASGTGHITYQGNDLLPVWPN